MSKSESNDEECVQYLDEKATVYSLKGLFNKLREITNDVASATRKLQEEFDKINGKGE